MTAIGILITTDDRLSPKVEYYTHPTKGYVPSYEVDPETILNRVHEDFREGWRSIVKETASYMLALPDCDGARVEVEFDVRDGFRFGATREPLAGLIFVDKLADVESVMPSRESIDAIVPFEITEELWESVPDHFRSSDLESDEGFDAMRIRSAMKLASVIGSRKGLVAGLAVFDAYAEADFDANKLFFDATDEEPAGSVKEVA